MARKMHTDEFLRYVAIPLFGFGVVTITGPRFMGFALGRASPEKTNLYWFSATPFEQSAEAIHQYDFNADTLKSDDLYAVHSIEKDIIKFLEHLKTTDQGYMTPTFIITDFDPKIDENFHKSITLMSEIVNHSAGGRQTLAHLRKYPKRSLDRLSYEVKLIEAGDYTPSKENNEIPFKDVLELTMTIVDPDHIQNEMKALMMCWTGLIRHHVDAGNYTEIKDAMSFNRFVPLLSLFPKLGSMLE